MNRALSFVRLLAVGVLMACASGSSPEGVANDTTGQVPPPGPVPRGETPDDPTIQRLEREARALANTDGCANSGQCRTAPVGNRPCGGPRTYFVYCALTTDSAALFRKLDELSRAEGEYNRRNQLGSTCEFRMPPDVVLSGRSCQAAPARP